MVENKAATAPETAISPENQQKLAFAVAGTILVVAILLAILIARRTPQYEAQARVAYSAAGAGAGLQTSAGAGPALASSLLSDTELAQVIDRYDLYPQLRQKQSTASTASFMREKLTLAEPEQNVVQISFQDADQEKTRTVANALAGFLTEYQVMSSVPAAPIAADKPGRSRRQARQARKLANPYQPAPMVGKATVPESSHLNASSSAEVTELSHQVDRVDTALIDLQASRTELEKELHQVAGKIEILEKTEHRPSSEGRGASQAEAARSVVQQDLAAAQAKLASLRDRYTDAYPDVQTTKDEIAALQVKLAGLPVPRAEKAPVASTEQNEAMEALRQERQRVDLDLGKNSESVQAETTRRASLEAELARARISRTYHPAPQVNPLPAVPAPPIAASAQAPPANGLSGAMVSVPVLPFRLIESAGTAVLVTTSRLALGIWLGVGTVLLLALCFVPMVPAHYAAVVTTPEDLKKATPEHVTYLGDVGLGDVGRTER